MNLAWTFLFVGCVDPAPSESPSPSGVDRITVAGSTALVPLATEAANRFMSAHPDVAVEISAGGSLEGLDRVAAGEVDIGTSDVEAPAELAGRLEDHRVAVVAIAAMAHAGPNLDGVSSLTRAQAKGIFTGRIRNWSEVGGGDMPILVVNRPPTSGTRAAFRSIVLGDEEFTEGIVRDSSGQVASTTLERPGAIAYLALSYRTDGLRILAYDGVEPTPDEIRAGRYRIWSYEHLYVRPGARAHVRAFIDSLLVEAFQRDTVPRFGFLPVLDAPDRSAGAGAER